MKLDNRWTWPGSSCSGIHKQLQQSMPKGKGCTKTWDWCCMFKSHRGATEPKEGQDQGPEHSELHRRVKRQCRQAKWWCFLKIATEAEEATKVNNSNRSYIVMKTLTRKKSSPGLGIIDSHWSYIVMKTLTRKKSNPGLGITDSHWSYILMKTLTRKKSTPGLHENQRAKASCCMGRMKSCTASMNMQMNQTLLTMKLSCSEVKKNFQCWRTFEMRAVLKRMKCNKAIGGDQIPAETPQAGGETMQLFRWWSLSSTGLGQQATGQKNGWLRNWLYTA